MPIPRYRGVYGTRWLTPAVGGKVASTLSNAARDHHSQRCVCGGDLAAFANINEMVELTNIGTLFSFVLVSIGVLVLRYRDPHRPRPFRVPGSPITELLAVAFCVHLMIQLPRITWIHFIVWLAVGGLIYFGYGRRHSRLA